MVENKAGHPSNRTMYNVYKKKVKVCDFERFSNFWVTSLYWMLCGLLKTEEAASSVCSRCDSLPYFKGLAIVSIKYRIYFFIRYSHKSRRFVINK